jgi:hypothetical protein
MTIAIEIIAGLRALIEAKQLIDDQIKKQAERAGLAQEELDKLFEETRQEVLKRDPGKIPTPK